MSDNEVHKYIYGMFLYEQLSIWSLFAVHNLNNLARVKQMLSETGAL